ncbi:MAG: CPBP family intramembrane glutamic endopeptidase, partial [Candidatus Eisenbacteria bacterium]
MSGAPRRSFYVVAWIFYLVLAIAGLLWLGAQRGALGVGLFVEPGTIWVDLGAGLALAAILLALWWGMRRFMPSARALEGELAALVTPLTTSEALALALISAVAEELFFRGALQGAIGFLPAAVLFALLHGGPGRAFRAWGLFALVGGLTLGLYVAEREALGGAILAHALVNGVNLLRLV